MFNWAANSTKIHAFLSCSTKYLPIFGSTGFGATVVVCGAAVVEVVEVVVDVVCKKIDLDYLYIVENSFESIHIVIMITIGNIRRDYCH